MLYYVYTDSDADGYASAIPSPTIAPNGTTAPGNGHRKDSLTGNDVSASGASSEYDAAGYHVAIFTSSGGSVSSPQGAVNAHILVVAGGGGGGSSSNT